AVRVALDPPALVRFEVAGEEHAHEAGRRHPAPLAAHVVVHAGGQLGEVDGGEERADVTLVDGGELEMVAPGGVVGLVVAEGDIEEGRGAVAVASARLRRRGVALDRYEVPLASGVPQAGRGGDPHGRIPPR